MEQDDVEDTLQINISGTIFQVQVSTLQRFPNSRLANLVDNTPTSHKNTALYFDQDAMLFGYILGCCRSGEVHVPTTVCPNEFLKELIYWGIPVKNIAPCCLPTFYKVYDSVEILEKLTEVTSQSCDSSFNKTLLSVKEKLWQFLDDPCYSLGAKIWYYGYLAVVGLSILIYLCWMVPSLRVARYLQQKEFNHNHNNSKISSMTDTDPHIFLFVLDLFCMVVFVGEFILRFVVCPKKLKFFTVWYNILNAILVVSTLTSLFLELRKDVMNSKVFAILYYIIKNCYVFRLLLLLRLEKQYMPLKLLILSVRESARELLLLIFSLFMAMCVFGGLIFCAEIHTTQFQDIWVSLWWALITITTVGYGDFYPTDLPGRFIGSLCAICGVMLIALPTAVIVSKFSDFYGHRSFQQRHEQMCQQTKADLKENNE